VTIDLCRLQLAGWRQASGCRTAETAPVVARNVVLVSRRSVGAVEKSARAQRDQIPMGRRWRQSWQDHPRSPPCDWVELVPISNVASA
jgi:hypothetical protein